MALSIDDLRSFILVATERSVTRAAAHLGVSQQSVSERIRRLESRLDTKLFTRLAFGMQPSPAGYRFLPYASRCVALVDQALAAVADDDVMRVRVQSGVSQAVVPLLEALDDTKVEVSLTDDTGTEALFSAVVAGSIDAAIGVFPATATSDPLEGSGAGSGFEEELLNGSFSVMTQSLFTDPVLWAAPPDHSLAKRGQPLPLSGMIVARAQAASSNGDPAIMPTELEGVRVDARSVLADDLASGRLVELPLDQPGWVIPISIAYRSIEHDRPAIVELRDALSDGRSGSAPSRGNRPNPPRGSASDDS